MGIARHVAVLGGLLLLCGASGHARSAEHGPRPDRVDATYRVDLAGLPLGEFQFSADFKGAAYRIEARGRFQLLAGLLYRASGKTMSAGTLTAHGPEPSRFMVSYAGGDKKESRQLSFDDGDVTRVSISPHKKKKRSRNVPVTEEQLEDVLDPLTAAFLSTRANGSLANPEVCRQTVPVFDGKQRFDIVLTPKRNESLAGGVLPGPAAVCKVKYVPIGGYRPDHPGVKFMSETEEIEVWLVLVPQAELYLPYRIAVPTAWGAGSVTLADVTIGANR